MPIIINEAINELSTLRDMLRWAVSHFNAAKLFYGHGTDNAWDEAVALILHALHLPPDVDPKIIDAKLTQSERRTIAELIARRTQERIPAAYLTQQAWFADLDFYIDKRALIPRSAMAELIEQQFAPWINLEQTHSILDLCTGSGCIAIACAKYFPAAHVDAIDISSDALAVAKINCDRHQVNDQIKLIESNLFEKIKNKKYDVIISNPPYVAAAEMQILPAEYQHEPALGLAAGEHGLDIVTTILKTAKQHLTPHGILIVEVGNSEEALIKQFPEVPFTWLEFERGDGGVFLLTTEQL